MVYMSVRADGAEDRKRKIALDVMSPRQTAAAEFLGTARV